MRAVSKRILHLIRKEFIHIRRDRGLMRMVVIAPLMQLVIYGYVVATEIRALPMVVLDHSESPESRRLIDRFVFSGYFELEKTATSQSDVTRELDMGRSLIALVIPTDYAENVRRGVSGQLIRFGSHACPSRCWHRGHTPWIAAGIAL